jgi:hypothetical protein
MINLKRLEGEYLELIEETARGRRPMVGLVREWSQIQRELTDLAAAGGIDEDEADRMLDRLFTNIDGRLSQM